jgi:hypothetical protein
MRTWAKRRLLKPLQKLLLQGISIDKLAISLALGITIGVIPFYGMTAILISVVALVFRLNLVAMHIAHYIISPLQLALLIPFFKGGSFIAYGTDVGVNIKEYIQLLHADFWMALQQIWLINLSAILVWLIIAIPVSVVLFLAIKKVLVKYAARLKLVPA